MLYIRSPDILMTGSLYPLTIIFDETSMAVHVLVLVYVISVSFAHFQDFSLLKTFCYYF